MKPFRKSQELDVILPNIISNAKNLHNDNEYQIIKIIKEAINKDRVDSRVRKRLKNLQLSSQTLKYL